MVAKYLLVLALFCVSAYAEQVSPCDVSDWRCIGRYLSRHAKCDSKRLDSKSIDPYFIDHIHLETPGFNCSEDRYGVTYTGLDTGYVRNFFINEETDKAVLTLVFPSLIHNTSVTKINYYAPGAEPFSISTTGVFAAFTDIIFTVMFDSATNLELKNAKIYTFLTKHPDWNLGDGSLQEAAKTNPQVAAVQKAWGDFVTIASLEPWNYRSPRISTVFINHNLCRYRKGADVPDSDD